MNAQRVIAYILVMVLACAIAGPSSATLVAGVEAKAKNENRGLTLFKSYGLINTDKEYYYGGSVGVQFELGAMMDYSAIRAGVVVGMAIGGYDDDAVGYFPFLVEAAFAPTIVESRVMGTDMFLAPYVGGMAGVYLGIDDPTVPAFGFKTGFEARLGRHFLATCGLRYIYARGERTEELPDPWYSGSPTKEITGNAGGMGIFVRTGFRFDMSGSGTDVEWNSR